MDIPSSTAIRYITTHAIHFKAQHFQEERTGNVPHISDS